jgi:hypothetical protein
MIHRRALLTAAPAGIAGLIVPARAEAATLAGLPLAAHYGELAAQAIAVSDGTQHFTMEVDAEGVVGFHNRGNPHDAIAYHLRSVRRHVAKVPAGQPTTPFDPHWDSWLAALARVAYGIELGD